MVRRHQRGIGTTYILLFLIAMLPVALVITAAVPVPLELAVAGGFLLQMGVVGVMMFYWRVSPKDPWLGLAIAYAFLQSLTLVSSTFEYGNFDPLDLVNVGVKAVNVVIFAGLAQALIPREEDINRLLGGFLWVACVAVAVNLLLGAGDFSRLTSVTSSYQLDFSSFFANRNQFGSFLFLSIVAHALYLHEKKVRIRHFLLFSVQIGSLLLSMSRGALAAVLIFFLLFSVLHLTKRPAFLFALIGIGFGAVGVAAAFGWIELLRSLLVRPESGLSGREELWILGLQLWLDSNILLGIGSFRGIEVAQSQGMVTAEFHASYVEVLVGGGLAELILLFVILALIWTRLAASSLDSYRRHILFAAGAGVMMLSVVESISVFTMGLVGTMFTTFIVTLPILYTTLARSAEKVSLESSSPLPVDPA